MVVVVVVLLLLTSLKRPVKSNVIAGINTTYHQQFADTERSSFIDEAYQIWCIINRLVNSGIGRSRLTAVEADCIAVDK